jgi:hypothetical protein
MNKYQEKKNTYYRQRGMINSLPVAIPASSDHTVFMLLESDYSMVIRLSTPFTPFTSSASLVARFHSAALLALPYNVTLPLFVSTLMLMALVDR